MSSLSQNRAYAAAALALACIVSGPASADAPATLSRSVVVAAPPNKVWAAIGPFCAIGQWHPAIGSCAISGKGKPTRTLVTRDGQAKFVELQVARSEAAHSYSYSFTSAPVPVTHYVSTFSVSPSGKDASLVTWKSEYIPNEGQAAAAAAALTGIYESGLAAIQKRFAKP
jgi:uncharacterized protein YndB with AHSA1/START domain